MESTLFNFTEKSLNRLFPFYILMDSNLSIQKIGSSLQKLFPEINSKDLFETHFTISRPHYSVINLETVSKLNNELIVLEGYHRKISIRGQFEFVDNTILFLGSPWFTSMDEVIENKLTLHDFSLSDPLLDLLHVMNNQAITTQELKETLQTINEQKNKLKRDQEELNRLSLVASVNENGIVFTHPNGKIFWCNDAYINLTGFSKEEVIGRTPIEVGKCEYTKYEDLQTMLNAFYAGENFDVELAHGKKDGTFFWTKTKGQPIKNKSGEVTQYFAMVEDITFEKNAKAQLKESENRLSSLIVNLEVAILLESKDRKILLANKKFCSMFGIEVPPELLIGADCSNAAEESKLYFKDSEQFVARIKQILEEKQTVLNEHLELADGRIYQRSYIPIYKEGIYDGHLWTYDDITIKKRYDENLENEKEKYLNIIANMNLGLIEVDLNDNITLINNSFCEMSGFSESELIGKNAENLLVSKEKTKELQSKTALRKKGVSDSYEVEILNKIGENRHWLISGAPSYNISGQVIGSIGIHLDITEQKRQEQQLYLLSLIAEKNINAVVISDRDGKIEWVNSSFIAMSGYSLEEMKGIKPGKLLQGTETDAETVRYLKHQIELGLPFNCEIINYSKSGEKYWVKIQGQALKDNNGEIIRFFAIEEDITNKKLLETQKEELLESLAKSNKELEDYAQVVSHDLKSPLRSIHSLLSWIKEDNDKEFNKETLSYLNMIENKVEKMDHLIEGILTYAKIDKVEIGIEQINLQEIVENIINIIHIPQNVTVKITDELPTIEADKFRMQQLFQNLIGNAVTYIDKPVGVVEVGCEKKNNHYLFSIKDNGPGIAPENQEKIFKIFQSFTKHEGSTGIGLSIVKKIVETYKGKIWVESELGQGTTFFIKLNKS